MKKFEEKLKFCLFVLKLFVLKQFLIAMNQRRLKTES